jgi:hypothetical protein
MCGATCDRRGLISSPGIACSLFKLTAACRQRASLVQLAEERRRRVVGEEY